MDAGHPAIMDAAGDNAIKCRQIRVVINRHAMP